MLLGNGGTDKLSITLPKDLADEVRNTVAKRRISAFFAEAVRKYLAQYKQRVALERSFGAWSNENHPELRTPEDTVIYVRHLREIDEYRLKEQENKG
ncbi:MAG: ribbon-helix-helix domain-containing protein [Actinobacteria bacterium]|nr:ribbon-helix-helix domain-containing protein [Actinomycetota bacterium]